MPETPGPRLSQLDNLRELQFHAWLRGERLLVEALIRNVMPPLHETELLELICKRRRETVALGGAWRAVESCSAHVFSC